MKALEFVKMMREETHGNTDIAASTWYFMTRMADHYDQCRECREAFDDMQYDDEDLLEVAARIEQTKKDSDWICDNL